MCDGNLIAVAREGGQCGNAPEEGPAQEAPPLVWSAPHRRPHVHRHSPVQERDTRRVV